MDHKHTYTCEPCVFHTTCKRDYERHLLTQKHIDGGGLIKQIIKSSDGYSCSSCHNIFKSRTSIYKHISRCKTSSSHGASGVHTANPADDIICADDKITITKEMFMTLLQNNQEMMKMIKALAEQPTLNNTTNNTTNTNSHNTNCHNPTFNMNLFLNEKCKDAMNMKDFVNSIQLNLTDLENVGRLGYVEGMSNIIIDNLQKTDVYKRPVHCSDVKRETLYVKDDNKWEREGPNHQKMVNAVLAVEQKNVALVGEWAKANPKCMNSNTRENERYFRLSKVATDGEKDGNIAKVIRNVAKKVMVDKDTNMNE
jgi:hypothetical protein